MKDPLKQEPLTFTRNTFNGSEWWDPKNQKVVFMDFIYTGNPLDEEQAFIKTDATGKEKSGKAGTATLDREKEIEGLGKPLHTTAKATSQDVEEEAKGSIFNDMTIRELKDYAKAKEIEIPKDIKAKQEVIDFLQDNK